MKTITRAVDIKNIENQTEENCFWAVIKTNGEAIKYILSPSDNIIKFALRIDGNNIRFIPDEKKTEEVCMLAAIHGASSNILPICTEDIQTTCELISYMKESYKASCDELNKTGQTNGPWSPKLGNIQINGEWTNFSNKFNVSLFEDIPDLIRYYIGWGYTLKDNQKAPVFIKDGKICTVNSYLKDFSKTEKYDYSVGKVYEYYLNGRLDTERLKKAFKVNPAFLFEIKESDWTPDLVTESIYKNLDIKYYEKLFEKFPDAVTKAGVIHALVENDKHNGSNYGNEVIAEIFRLNGDVLTEKIFFAIANRTTKYDIIPNKYFNSIMDFTKWCSIAVDSCKAHNKWFTFEDELKIKMDLFSKLLTNLTTDDIKKISNLIEENPCFISRLPDDYLNIIAIDENLPLFYKYLDWVESNSKYTHMGWWHNDQLLGLIKKYFNETQHKLLYKHAEKANLKEVIKFFKTEIF